MRFLVGALFVVVGLALISTGTDSCPDLASEGLRAVLGGGFHSRALLLLLGGASLAVLGIVVMLSAPHRRGVEERRDP